MWPIIKYVHHHVGKYSWLVINVDIIWCLNFSVSIDKYKMKQTVVESRSLFLIEGSLPLKTLRSKTNSFLILFWCFRRSGIFSWLIVLWTGLFFLKLMTFLTNTVIYIRFSFLFIIYVRVLNLNQFKTLSILED